MKLYYGNLLVGEIKQIGRFGDFLSMSYSEDWLKSKASFPVSLSMPMTGDEISGRSVTDWASNLLPEGEQLHTLHHNLRQSRVSSIISQMGLDTAGALRFERAGKDASYIPLSEKDLERILDDLPSKPFLAGDNGVSLSLAGAQYKLPVAVFDGVIYLPLNGASSTHIIKPDSSRFNRIYDNEALCMRLAEQVSGNAVNTSTHRAGKRSYILVERYDRIVHGFGEVERIHQEDFCQALGLAPSMKYETYQNDMLAKALGTRTTSMTSLFDVARHVNATMPFLEAVVFNVMIGNSDAHAKNYSVLLSHGKPRLAPLYDLVCCSVYSQRRTGNLSQKMSQKIGGRLIPYALKRAHWERFADDVGLSRVTVLDTVARMSELVEHHIGEVAREKPESKWLLEVISKRTQHVARMSEQTSRGQKKAERLNNEAARSVNPPSP